MTEEESKRSKKLDTVGNKDTMNLHNILYQNIISSPYFKGLYEIKSYHEVIDEIYESEPFFKGNNASTAFCLLFKLWTLKLTVKQVQGLITHKDSPHIRALGFLYLRYVCKPADLWDWFGPYLDDEEELLVEAGLHPRSMTIGRLCRDLLTENKWIGTILPRIPVPIARELEKKLKEHPPVGAEPVREEAPPARGFNGNRNAVDYHRNENPGRPYYDSGPRNGRDYNRDQGPDRGYDRPDRRYDARAAPYDCNDRRDPGYRRHSRSPGRDYRSSHGSHRSREDDYSNIKYDDDDRYVIVSFLDPVCAGDS
ncbi:putative RNA binding protein [Fimicolochytrium jonesii]|uniref:putative RNA binding protein n=1 Tax=Fimicolochytrium jonesii TaxID=1396493 RepID=UPI0022FEB028|nr:putative RNA binding protein [Fimicolochytrium jonesii]KAI8823461.1 putative RNA binding protein [Fimicolochytrium jonesii]